MGEIRKLQTRLRRLETRKVLPKALVGQDGIDVDDAGAIRLLDRISKAVKVLLNSDGLQFANEGTIFLDNGSHLRLRTADGVYVVHFGTAEIPDGSGRPQQVAAIARDDGTPAITVADYGEVLGHLHQQVLAFWDRLGNQIFADDTISGEGFAFPFIAAGVWSDINVPVMSTNSSTWSMLQWNRCVKLQPRIGASILAYTPAGTAGQLRMTFGGVQVGATVDVPSNSFGEFGIDPAPWPAGTPYRQEGILVLEGRVTSGPDSIAARGLSLLGRGS